MFRIGLIINPYAGIGGRVGLKGSDGDAIRAQALQLGGKKLAQCKAENALREIVHERESFEILTASKQMGQTLCQKLQLSHQVVYQAQQPSSAKDTQQALLEIQKQQPDLILFVGGDGTARDIYQVINEQQVVLGIPAGVKIHSAVYAVSAQAAGIVVHQLIKGQLVNLTEANVVDLDEQAFRLGQVKSQYYGEMLIPDSIQYMQAVKQASQYHQQQNLEEIADYIIEEMEHDFYYVIGSGTSCAAIMQQLGLDNTLLGSDIIYQGQLVKADANEQDLLEYLGKGIKLRFILTVIGGQGHILGRGNHQISPAVVNAAGWENFIIIASEQKIKELQSKPLLVDSGDKQLDSQLEGMQKVIIGYRSQILYALGLKTD
ncbi:MAG: ATP-NAD kinase family protein [Enterobacterales bacterium]|nr:ATP-NAD kinase family protein [Enterobacterales bacterium]